MYRCTFDTARFNGVKPNWGNIVTNRKLMAACLVALASGAQANAQSTTGPGADVTSGGLEEVVVTARRREESIQSVPVAVSSVGGAELTAEGITDIVALGTKMPGLNITAGAGAGSATPVFSIRGLSQQELTILADPSVTLYMGDLVYARAQGANSAMFDIDRVEVLKGPQGTLFGRNTTGGAIVVRPARPSTSNEGMASVTYGNFATRMFEAMANVTLGDRAQLRIAGVIDQDDGYMEDVITGRSVNHTDTEALRISFAAQPTDKLDTLFVYNQFDEDDGGTGTFIYQVNETRNAAGAYTTALCGAGPSVLGWGNCTDMLAAQEARGPRKVQSGAPVFTKINTWDLTNTTSYAISDTITVKNILGYRSVENHNYEDTDGTPWPVLSIERIDEFTQWSEELQLLGSTEKLDWIVGAYWFNEEGENQGLSMTAQREPAPGNTDAYGVEPLPRGFPSWSNTNVEGDNTSEAVFAQGTWRFTDAWSLTAGARYTQDEKTAVIKNHLGDLTGPTACRFTVDTDGNPATPEVNPGIANCRLPVSEDFSEPTWNLSLEYKPTDDMLYYLAHRHGYRSGGFGARAGTQAGLERTFEPETVDDIELGAKVDWDIGGRKALRTNLALYYSDYQDIQRLLTDPSTVPVTTVTTNAGKAEIKGAEFELNWYLTDSLEFSGWYAYTDAEFTEFTAPDGRDLSIFPFARAPENVYSAALDYTLPIDASKGTMSIGASYWYTDEYSFNDDFQPTVMVDSYSLVNLRADWKNIFGSPLDIGAYVRNATDEEYTLEVLNLYTALGFDGRTIGEPRTYGIRASYNFGAR
jgi:iron complex outermembrane receptor protein